MEFLIACENNNIDLINELLSKGIDINTEIDNLRPLSISAKNNNLTLLRFLLIKGAEYTFDFYNPWRMASIYGSLEVLQYLLNLDSSPNILEMITMNSWNSNQLVIFEYLIEKFYKNSPLEYAYKNKFLRIIENLITDNLESALCDSASLGYLDMVKYLIDSGIRLDWNENQPLINASYFGYFDIANFLIERGADISSRNYEAFLSATMNNYEDVSFLLLEKGSDVNTKNGQALCYAVENKNLNLLKYFIEKGGILREENYLLPIASKNGDIEMMQFLIDNGFDVNFDNNQSLIMGCIEGHFEVVKFLVENGADIHARNDESICYACYSGNPEIVKYLLNKGVNIKKYDALTECCFEGHFEIVKILVNYGLNIHIDNEKPLNSAVCGLNYDIVEYLLSNGAEIKKYILENSIDIKNYYITKLLVKYGANLSELDNIFKEKYKELMKKYPIAKKNYFRNSTTCPISLEEIGDNDELLGCNMCKNIFRIDVLESWLILNNKCPFRCEKSVFYLVDNS